MGDGRWDVVVVGEWTWTWKWEMGGGWEILDLRSQLHSDVS
jgi:hypothetical protein